MKLFDILPPISLAFALIPSLAQAQLIPDNSLGAESSVVTPQNPSTDRIDGGAVRGSNLFHSFGEFNVDVGRSVYFANPAAIQNILTRVTGGNPSNIFGTLGVLGNANLFLINPSGIVFGRSARLDIGGSFFATTGEGIKLGEDGMFSAKDLDPSSLLDVRPEALFHNALANHMAKLNNRGNLAVGTGPALVLHGGEVRNSGSLTAPGGTVMVLGERIALLDDAFLDVSSATGGGRVFIGGLLQGRGNIPTAERTYLGLDVTISADAAFRGDGGNVIVWADEVTGFHGNISARGGLYGGDGGFVEVSGGEILRFRGQVDTTAARGKAGTLLLDPRNILIANGEPSMEISDAQTVPEDIFNGAVGDTEEVTIYSSALEGLSGDTNVVLQATNDIVVADLSDNSLSLAPGTGDITFIADADRDGVGDFTMADPADTINTNGRSIAITGASLTLGNIDTSLPAPDGAGELLSTAVVVSTGPGEPLNSISGNLFGAEDVDLYQIYLTGEGTFSATTIDGSNVDTQLFLFDADGLGLYGNDNNRGACNCRQSTLPGSAPLTPTTPGIYYLGINVDGVNPVSESGEIFAATRRNNLLEPTGAGTALPLVGWEKVEEEDEPGDYTITLTGVEAASATFAEVIDNTVKSNSGAITLRATNGNITTVDLNAASFSGAGGEIRLDATADIVLNGSSLDASGVVGGGGEITLNSGGKINLNSSSVTSSTNGVGDAGKVTITARDTVRFNGGSANSQVNPNGSGDAGGIEITTGSLELMDGARLNARTFGEGNAGKISIAATERVLLRGENSQGQASGASTLVTEDGSGSARGIEITTGSLELMDGALLSASTRGEGDAGNIFIAATEKVLLRGENSEGLPTIASTVVGESALGSAGGIEITTGSLELMDGARLSASTFGEGDAGNIFIAATERVLFAGQNSEGRGSRAFSQVGEFGEGDAGDIEITTGSLELMDGAQLSTSTEGKGDAGNIFIAATERVLLRGENSQRRSSRAFSQVEEFGEGDAGRIEITTGSLELMDGARLNTRTEGKGDAGTIKIAATERVLFAGQNSRGLSTEVSSEVRESASGSAGDIEITTGSLELMDGGELIASTFGKGDAGNIFIAATERVLLRGEDSRDFNGVFSQVGEFGEGKAGGIEIRTGLLDLGEGTRVSASTAGIGNAGNIEIEAAQTINIFGLNSRGNSSGLFVESGSEAMGKAGDIIISTSSLNLGSAGVINARTQNGFTGGDIEIDTDRLSVTGGAQISSSSFSRGDAGTIRIDAREGIAISGADPNYNSRVAEFGKDVVDTVGPESAILSSALSTGTAGTVTLKTGQLQVSSDAEVSVSSADGIAGSLNIIASEINLNNGTLSARTAEGNEGNITIDAPTVVLENKSAIATDATRDATGGNITIATENLVASDDSDISANAIDGRGGNISITASGVFLDNDSEITATSDRGVDGTVEIQAQLDPARGAIALSDSPVDASSLISKGCEEYRGSEFIITGRGGIPPHPFETLPGEVIWLDWRALTDENSSLGYSVPDETSPVESVVTPEEDDEIRQAQGWLQLPDGTVVLTAYPVKMTPAGPVMQHPGCQIILGDREQ